MKRVPSLSIRRAMRVALAVLLFALPGLAGDVPGQWERVRVDDGIVVDSRETPGSPVLSFRGSGVVNAPLLTVASVLVDTSRATEWVDSLEEIRLLRKVSETEYVYWQHIGTPITMSDRDFVISTKLEVEEATGRIFIRIHSVSDPLAPRTDYVRGTINSSGFVLTPLEGGRTRVETEIHCDPRGGVAKWIVNMVQKNWPYNTITRLRGQASKPNVRPHPLIATLLQQRGAVK